MNYLIIGIPVLLFGGLLYFIFKKKEIKKGPVIPMPKQEVWRPLINDLKTALSGSKKEDWEKIIFEFQNRIDRYKYDREFLIEYNKLVK